MHFRVFAVTTLLAASALLAGCTGEPDETVQAGGNVEPSPVGTGNATPGARFEVASIEILRGDATPGLLYEDDRAVIRYIVRQPTDAERAESAFVTYVLNGRIVDVTQHKLEPGEEKRFERRIDDLRAMKTISVEVRAASSVAKTDAQVHEWPRAGVESLAMGPLEIRADYGLMEQDGRVLVNLSIVNAGPIEHELREFRAKMLCALPNGTIRSTNSVHLPMPSVGERGSLDAYLDDCGNELRYGIEFKGENATGEIIGRLLLVEDGWAPASA